MTAETLDVKPGNTGAFQNLTARLSLVQKLFLGSVSLCLLALLLPLSSLALYLVGIDYYQHFPLLVLGGFFLAYRNWKASPVAFAGELTPRVAFWFALGVCLTAGVFVIPSRWMSSVASFALLVSVIHFWGGRELGKLWFGPLCLFAAAIPLPAGLGTNFVVWLQQVATTTASLWLEFFNIAHDTSGVSIQTGQHDYLVKEACSGINSIYAAVAIGVTYAVLRHYSLWRLLTLVGQLIFWVIAANATRVFVMVAMREKFDIDLIDSAIHEVVGGVTFLFGIALAFSGDHITRYLLPLPTSSGADWLIEVKKTKQPGWIDSRISVKVAYALIGTLACLAIASVTLLYRYEASQGQSRSIQELVGECCIDFADMDETFLPPVLGEWNQVGYERIEREADSVFGGMVSFQWRYAHPSGRASTIQIDGPYTSWHDLTVCYRGDGWDIEQVANIEEKVGDEAVIASEIFMTKGALDHGHSLFYCVDQSTENVPPILYYSSNRSLNGVFARVAGVFAENREIDGGAIQLQLFDTKPGILDKDERSENRALFWLAVNALNDRITRETVSGEALTTESTN